MLKTIKKIASSFAVGFVTPIITTVMIAVSIVTGNDLDGILEIFSKTSATLSIGTVVIIGGLFWWCGPMIFWLGPLIVCIGSGLFMVWCSRK